MYLITGLGNLLIILAIRTDSHLHTPMYFFLSNLSLADICFTSTTILKMLANHVSGNKVIPYSKCLTQVFFFIWFAGIDSFLLTAMAYDCYAAVCVPLHYSTATYPGVCTLLLAVSWFSTSVNSLTHTTLLTRLSFCGHNEIPHIFCDLSPRLSILAEPQMKSFINDLMLYTVGVLLIITPFIGILISYTHIFMAVFKIPSVSGKQKAFSTCGSHLVVVSLLYGTLIGVYLNLTSTHTAQKDTAAAMMY
ncbi:olfactory receptor 1f45-like [Sminthopsis crassicaudata]|uniref:olfactory receptor 1f45-like n=1 Tax=Sminthopsis crassicaudata TaxID=9301 RepID=UPI003D681089